MQRRSYTVSTVLSTALTVLVVCAVAPVLVITYLINASNADALLSDRAELLIDGLEGQLRGLLDPVATQLEIARDYIEQNDFRLEDSAPIETYIEGFINGAAQVSGVGILRTDGSMRRWEEGETNAIEEPSNALPFAQEALDQVRESDATSWSEPFVSLALGDTILNPRIALRRNGQYIGVLTAAVTGKCLSEYVSGLTQREVTAFILYNHDRIIAYPNQTNRKDAPTSTELPFLEESSLPIISQIWVDPNPLSQTTKMVRTQGHWSHVGDSSYAYFYRSIAGYGPGELLVGVAMPSKESRLFRWAALLATAISTLLLGIAVVAAFSVARRLSAPVVQLEDALSKLEHMQFEGLDLPELQRSRITEWSESAKRLSKAARALTLFNQYVPSQLARRLMNQPHEAATAQERHVSVMFVDMEGFSEFSREHTAAEVAAHLNVVFELIGPIIEQTGGVIDKYTGDGLMAFWGAPDVQLDHQRRALIAALEIRHVLSDPSCNSQLRHGPRLRIGLHSGQAIVGNLGFEGRINYTLVGSTVNVAERVEQCLKGLSRHQMVVIGLSEPLFADAATFEGIELTEIQSQNDLQVAVVSGDTGSAWQYRPDESDPRRLVLPP